MKLTTIHWAAIGAFVVGSVGVLSQFPTWHAIIGTPIALGAFLLQIAGVATSLYAKSVKTGS